MKLLAEHSQPSAHDGDDDQNHGRAKHDGDQRNPRDATLAEVFEDEVEFVHQVCGFISGNRITSRMLSAPVSIMSNRSTPIPMPPAGGMPYFSAFKKSSSSLCCSSFSPT